MDANGAGGTEEKVESAKPGEEIVAEIQTLIAEKEKSHQVLVEVLKEKLQTSEYPQNVRNSIYHSVCQILADAEWQGEEFLFLKQANKEWSHLLGKTVQDTAKEFGLPIYRKRTVGEQDLVESRWKELGSEELEYPDLQKIYSPKDLLHYLLNSGDAVDNEDGRGTNAGSVWSQAGVSLRTRDICELREMFSSCDAGGVERPLPHEFLDPPDFDRYEREELGDMIFETEDVLAAREFMKSGCPHSLRRHFWSLVLGITATEKVEQDFEQLKKRVIKYEFFIDQIVFKDVRTTACNDEEYFVFEDILYEVLLAFIRDTQVAQRIRNGAQQTNPTSSVAACSVIPFDGFTMYVAPLCFMYADIPEMYAVFRELYCRYFYKLSCISSHPQSILSLMLTFERLLRCKEPDLLRSLAAKNMTLLPVAIKLLTACFAGCLPVEDVLEVWDRILAYDSLYIIPVFAAAIVYSTKEDILKAEDQTALEALLSKHSPTPVIPLLIKFLDNECQ